MPEQTNPQPLSDEQLAAIEARATHELLTPGPWRLDFEQCDCSDGYCHHGAYVAGVVASSPTEIAAERCQRTGEQPRDYDFHRSEIGDFTTADWELMAHAREDLPALVADVKRLRARLWEHERPATEAERNALRQSFMELAAQAHEDRDYEGAFEVECRLRDREEQWKAEDAARTAPAEEPAAAEADTLPAWLYQRFAVIHGCPPWDTLTDSDRAYWEHQAAAVRRAVARGGFKTQAVQP